MRSSVAILLFSLGLSVVGAERISSRQDPLWDRRETIAEYAKRTHLPPVEMLLLGNGVSLELVLIPAGRFLMGTREPPPVDEERFSGKILAGQAVFSVGGGLLVLLLSVVLLRTVRQRQRPQYSLARFLTMTVAAGVGLLGGLHWWYSARELAVAEAEYQAALARFTAASDTEMPAHEVKLAKAFYIGRYEVTQEQYQQVMGENPSRFKGLDLPVDSFGWNDAQAFCKKASDKTGATVRLPTEAEWEYACRAGTETTYCSGDEESDLDRVGWYDGNSGLWTHPVGQKAPNAWGVFDMLGNVDEWCEDDLHENYCGAPSDGQAWNDLPRNDKHVVRGGSMDDGPQRCRSAYRRGYSFPYVSFGFRVVVQFDAR
jgi:formylglycine-generating enzyme required for sulfatase activity